MDALSQPITLPTELFEQLSRLADERQTTIGELLQEAVALFLAAESEALADFEEGIRQIEAGEFYTHEQVRAQIDALLQKRNAA